MRNLVIISLLFAFAFATAGCVSVQKHHDPIVPEASGWEPLGVVKIDEIYRVCGQTLGITCDFVPENKKLFLSIDQTGTPEETQRGVNFVSVYFCRLARLEGHFYTSVTVVYPDASTASLPCSSIGLAQD